MYKLHSSMIRELFEIIQDLRCRTIQALFSAQQSRAYGSRVPCHLSTAD